ncbi:MAG: UDP-4-amino-4,6-dideoxy-N-acetyl-beta-L-altrosamine transaminase [Pseudomonadota bacterium]
MKKVMITGMSGLLGSNIAYFFRNNYQIIGLYNNHSLDVDGMTTLHCDLLDKNRVKELIDTYEPEIIIHCASIVNVDFCEQHQDITRALNVGASAYLCGCINPEKQKLIFISSDSVYSGEQSRNNEKNIGVGPKNFYGISKLETEAEISKIKNSLILRTNIFGWNVQDKKSLGEWILGSFEDNKTVSGFKDAEFSPIYTMELSRIIELAIKKNLCGIYNCSSADSCTKLEFITKVAEKFNLPLNKIKSISIDDFNFIAKRGKKLSLDVSKIERDLNYAMPPVDISIDQFYRDLKSDVPLKIKHFSKVSGKSKTYINYGRQSIDNNDCQAVRHTLKSPYLTQGPEIAKFEARLAEFCGAKYSLAVNSGTSALHIACLAAGLKKGDEVITSPITFVASANCAIYCGAKPVFADVDEKTYNLSSESLKDKINKNTKVVIPVHFAGQSCDMEKIREIVNRAEKKYGNKIYIVEDACHALGSMYKETPVGSCVYSDMSVMSFHPVKHITTGEGGALTTGNKRLYEKIKLFRSHGITSNIDSFQYRNLAINKHNNLPNPWYYEQISLGYNYRITDIQCALGRSQLERLSSFIERRRDIVNRYNKAFKDMDFIHTPFEDEKCDSNFHLYVLKIDFTQIGVERNEFMDCLNKKGIQTQVHYIPVHTQPYYQLEYGTEWGDCPVAENYYQECLSIPLFPSMIDAEVDRVIQNIRTISQSKLLR